ncbi:hypothetical protein RBSH_01468 [Rhodopirellula baltica SH28]|uniref:Uncharacterized protein n=1 Tax=Rhodopirellula baltica SH28 TaxID=993517 RepID=K5DL18_RHOBT|nr:hypothetical protein RBSH_01468 [Rhodopirellula baltica SH28]
MESGMATTDNKIRESQVFIDQWEFEVGWMEGGVAIVRLKSVSGN